jgi:hypothetical protein
MLATIPQTFLHLLINVIPIRYCKHSGDKPSSDVAKIEKRQPNFAQQEESQNDEAGNELL